MRHLRPQRPLLTGFQGQFGGGGSFPAVWNRPGRLCGFIFSSATPRSGPLGATSKSANRPSCVLVVLSSRGFPVPTGGPRLRHRPHTNSSNREVRWRGGWAPWGRGLARALKPKFESVCSAHIRAPSVTTSTPAHNLADGDEAMAAYRNEPHSDTHTHPPFALCWASAG